MKRVGWDAGLVGWLEEKKKGRAGSRGEKGRESESGTTITHGARLGRWGDGGDRQEGKRRERKGKEGQEGGKREVCLCVCVMSVCLCYAKHPVPAVCFFSLLFPACGQKGSRGTRKDKGKAHKKKKHKAQSTCRERAGKG